MARLTSGPQETDAPRAGAAMKERARMRAGGGGGAAMAVRAAWVAPPRIDGEARGGGGSWGRSIKRAEVRGPRASDLKRRRQGAALAARRPVARASIAEYPSQAGDCASPRRCLTVAPPAYSTHIRCLALVAPTARRRRD
eukprot:8841159-Pyramimonas_sp.AAC.1